MLIIPIPKAGTSYFNRCAEGILLRYPNMLMTKAGDFGANRVKRMYKVFLLGVILLFAGILNAQEPAGRLIPPELLRRVGLLYRLEFNDDFFFVAGEAGSLIWDDFSGPFPEQKETWYHSLEAALNTAEKVAQVVRGADGTDLFTQAVSKAIPVFIHVRFSGDIDTATVQISYTFRGVFSDLYEFENSYEEDVPREEDLLSYFWLPLISDLETFLEQIASPPLLIRGPAGTLVYGFSKKPLRIPETEYIFVEVPIPGTYKWRMVHKRYLNRKGIFMADKEHPVLTLPRERFSPATFMRFLDRENRTYEQEE